jgi:hypothetical protein
MAELTADQRSDYARYLGSRPKSKVERTCVVCGVKFQGTRRALYHSDSCKLRAQRERQKELGTTRKSES